MARRDRQSTEPRHSVLDTASKPQDWTWSKINEHMNSKYGRHYTPGELRQMEVKWRRILSDAGWSVKGQ